MWWSSSNCQRVGDLQLENEMLRNPYITGVFFTKNINQWKEMFGENRMGNDCEGEQLRNGNSV